MLWDYDVVSTDALPDGSEDLNGPIAVEAASQKQKAAVLVVVVQQPRYGTSQVDGIPAICMVVLILAEDATSWRPDVAVQLNYGRAVGRRIRHRIHAIDHLIGIRRSGIEGLLDQPVVVSSDYRIWKQFGDQQCAAGDPTRARKTSRAS